MSFHRVTITGTYTELGIQAQNVVHVLNIDGAKTNQQIALDFRDFWCNAWRGSQSNVWRYDWINVRNLDQPDLISHQENLAPPILGQSSNNVHSPTLTPVITLQTQRIGPSGRGRIYLPGVHTGMLSKCRITTAMASQFAAAVAILARYFPGGPGNSGLTLCIIGKNPDANGRPLVTSMILRSILGNQRRRNELHGF